MMNHKEILASAVNILKDRADLYGSEEDLFERVSILYNVMTGQQLTPYDINVVMVCVKLARMRFDRKVADKRTFPAIDITRSGTRKEELLVPSDILKKMYVLRRILNPMGTVDGIEFLLGKLRETPKGNATFFESMNT